MRLTVVGCSGSYPGPESAASCYLLEAEHDGRTWRIVLDLGNGALGQLHRYADPLAIDAVLVTHLHADHCLDLCGYYVLRKYHPSGPQPRIPVWGPEGTAERMARAYGTLLERMLAGATGMGREFGAGLSEVEARWLHDREWARDPEDVLMRRTKLGLHMTADEQAAFAAWWAEVFG